MSTAQKRETLADTRDYQELMVILKNELTDDAISSFSKLVDTCYKDAMESHYVSFNRNDTLLHPRVKQYIFELIRDQFPFHYAVFHSLIFTNIKYRKSRQCDDLIEGKKTALCNHFLAICRMRDSDNLIHWAMIGTLAIHGKGCPNIIHRNPIMKSFSTTTACALKHADLIYNKTKSEREYLIKSQPIGGHSLDNYNKHHAKTTQSDGKSSIYHTGMVYNLVQFKQFPIPLHTVLKSRDGMQYDVVGMQTQDAYNQLLKIIPLGGDLCDNTVIHYPQLGWSIVSVPGCDEMPSISYINQVVPSPIRFRIPRGMSDCDLLTKQRHFLTNEEFVEGDCMESLKCRRYHNLLLRRDKLLDIIKFSRLMKRDPVISQLADGFIGETVDVDSSFEVKCSILTKIVNRAHESIQHITSFQNDMVKLMNPHSDQVDQYILFPLSPRNEMSTAQCLLASIEIHKSLGLVDKAPNHKFATAFDSELRTIIQYGDVMTDDKWYSLELVVLLHLTEIGKEEYVKVVHGAMKRYIQQHDYLHENIHRLQAIYKLYYV
jgi:hypothetical protein